MKRVKIMLTVIFVFAVGGGALAFKAKGYNFQTYYITNGINIFNCNVKVTDLTENIDTGIYLIASTTSGTNNCSLFVLTDKEG